MDADYWEQVDVAYDELLLTHFNGVLPQPWDLVQWLRLMAQETAQSPETN